MLPIVTNDPWLHPVSDAVDARHDRYENRLKDIQNRYGSLKAFASAHTFLGFHYDTRRHGWWYREWAPAARYLALMGDFNDWRHYDYPLENIGNGIWEIFLPDSEFSGRLTHGSKLKVVVQSAIGEHERIPVYCQRVIQDEGSKDFAAQFWNPEKPYVFSNKAPELGKTPLLIYEAHVGMAQETEGVGTYKEFTEKILPRIKADGYNAVQLMAIAEHPYYGSFGYHVSNFFAPSSRFGTPEELKELIDTAHGMGLLVIMDLVHSHTVKNIREGLNLFDGSDHQYLHPGARGEHRLWDSKLFDYGKENTLQLLLSNVRYWLEDFHFDGFRFDGVTSMLYLDHGIGVVFDTPEKYFGSNVDDDAVTYLQLANTLTHELNPDAITIAEDVSGMPGLCQAIADGGMGFDYRLGMGLPDFWIKVLKDQAEEQWNMSQFFFTMNDHLPTTKTIAYAESHDQALVGDKTIAFRLMDKEMYTSMSIDTPSITVDRGIALHKMIRLFTITLGGEAWLNFMGNEFGHPEWIDFPRHDNGWSYQYARRQWSLVDNGWLKYKFMGTFDQAMLNFVKDNDILSSAQAWLLKADEENKTIIYERNNLIFVFNWGAKSLPDYEIPLKQTGDYRIIFSSDSPDFGGFGNISTDTRFPSEQRTDGIFMKIYNVSRTATVYQVILNSNGRIMG